MKSLQARFIVASVAVLLSCGLLAGLGGYRAAVVEASEILDTQLAQLVQTLLFLSRADTSNTSGDIGLSAHSEHSYMIFQVWKLKAGGDQFDSSPHAGLTGSNERPYPQLLLRSGEIDSKQLFSRKDGFSTATWEGRSFRIFARTSPNGEFRAIVGQDMIDREEMVEQIAWSNTRPYLLVLPAGIIALIWLTHRGLAPIRRLTVEVATRDPVFLQHLEIADTPKELWPLKQAINTLLDRLAINMEHERRFTGDAAHELRTPMAALRAQLDALRLADNREARIQAQQQASATADRLARLVNQLLTLARLDAIDAAQDVPLNLSELARDLCGEMAPAAVAKGIDLSLQASSTNMHGEEDALRILLRNLCDNALRYTQAGGRIQVRISQRIEHTRLVVADNGPGVADSQLAELGQRFNRLGRPDTSGVGLGLSIVLRIVERYRATLTFSNGLDGRGLAVTIDFPDRPA